MADKVTVYISVMKDSLQEKCEILQEILTITQEQEKLLAQKDMRADAFEATLDRKEKLILKMQELDNGFNSMYRKAEAAIKEDRQRFKPQILEIQNLIRVLTEYGVKIQALESKNKEKFVHFASDKKKEIHDFHQNNKTANSYYQNMANQHHQWQSYFLDKKN